MKTIAAQVQGLTRWALVLGLGQMPNLERSLYVPEHIVLTPAFKDPHCVYDIHVVSNRWYVLVGTVAQ